MKWIKVEEIRPQDCPIGRDECLGCEWYDDVLYHSNLAGDTDVICEWFDRNKGY